MLAIAPIIEFSSQLATLDFHDGESHPESPCISQDINGYQSPAVGGVRPAEVSAALAPAPAPAEPPARVPAPAAPAQRQRWRRWRRQRRRRQRRTASTGGAAAAQLS